MQCTYIIIRVAVFQNIANKMPYYCYLSLTSWQFPLGVCVRTITKTCTNYHLAWHDCRSTLTSYWYLLLHVNIIVQAYISSINCGNKHNVSSNDKFIFTGIFSEIICLYGQTFIHIICICYKLAGNSSISQTMRLYWQNLFTLRVLKIFWQVDKIKMHIVIPNDTGNSPNVKRLIDLHHGMIHMIIWGMKSMKGKLH